MKKFLVMSALLVGLPMCADMITIQNGLTRDLVGQFKYQSLANKSLSEIPGTFKLAAGVTQNVTLPDSALFKTRVLQVSLPNSTVSSLISVGRIAGYKGEKVVARIINGELALTLEK